MRRIITTFCLVLLVQVGANAAVNEVEESSTSLANIYEGNWNVRGYFDFTKHSGRRDDVSEFAVSLAGRYFLKDRIAMGLSFGFESSGDYESVGSLGPTVAYFFWNYDQLASFVGLTFRVGFTDATVSSMVLGELGLEYFIIPSVALGPSLHLNYYNSRRQDFQRFGVVVNLGIYL